MDGGSAGFAGATNQPTSIDGGSADFAGAKIDRPTWIEEATVLQAQQNGRLLISDGLLVDEIHPLDIKTTITDLY